MSIKLTEPMLAKFAVQIALEARKAGWAEGYEARSPDRDESVRALIEENRKLKAEFADRNPVLTERLRIKAAIERYMGVSGMHSFTTLDILRAVGLEKP